MPRLLDAISFLIGTVRGETMPFAALRKQLDTLRSTLASYGMHASVAIVEETIARMDLLGAPDDPLASAPADFLGSLNDLEASVRRELSQVHFLYLAPDSALLYRYELPFGEDVGGAFPACRYDAEEAAKCLALGRSTACVFHLMRCVERVAHIIAADVGVKRADIEFDSIQTIIDKTTSALTTRLNALRGAKKAKRRNARLQFYGEVNARLMAVKEAWRNDVMHARTVYTAEQAERVYRIVDDFMRHAATRLREPTKRATARKRRKT